MLKEIIHFDQEEYFKNLKKGYNNLKKEYIRSNLKIITDKGNN